MKAIWARIVAEPVMLLGILTAGIALAAAFGAKITETQSQALMGFAGAILFAAFGVRSQVTPNSKCK